MLSDPGFGHLPNEARLVQTNSANYTAWRKKQAQESICYTILLSVIDNAKIIIENLRFRNIYEENTDYWGGFLRG